MDGRAIWTPLLFLYLGVCLFFDLFPTFGPARVPYAGSNASVHVLHLGWPLPTAVIDPRSGVHAGRAGLFAVGMQIVFIVPVVPVMVVMGLMGKLNAKKGEPSGGGDEGSMLVFLGD